jgi:hypothetical protein
MSAVWIPVDGAPADGVSPSPGLPAPPLSYHAADLTSVARSHVAVVSASEAG